MSAEKKPFGGKPRDQWKPAHLWRRRPRGRRTEEVRVGNTGDPDADLRLYVFEMTTAGVTVRPKRGRKSRARLWPWASLANGVSAGGQMELIGVDLT